MGPLLFSTQDVGVHGARGTIPGEVSEGMCFDTVKRDKLGTGQVVSKVTFFPNSVS